MIHESLLIVVRCIISYVLALIIFRFMGKREIGEMSIIDLIIFLMMAEIIAMGIEDTSSSIWHSIVALVSLAALQKIVALSVRKDNKFQRVVEGIPSLIVKHGNLDLEEMRKTDYTVYDLMQMLRQNGVSDLRDVDYAVLEVTGKLSIFLKEKSNSNQTTPFTLPLIVDGEIQYDYLTMLDHSPKWLIEKLSKSGHDSIADLMYCSYREGEFYIQKRS